MAWLSFIELDKTVVLWSSWLVFCDYGFSVSALWCPLATPTVLLGFLLPWTLGEAGQRLTEFCQENALVIANTLLQQHRRRLYTWTSPDGQHRNQTDYILCSQRWRSSIQSAKTRLEADCDSDHELLIAKFRLKYVRKTTRPFRYDLNQMPYDYTVERKKVKSLSRVRLFGTPWTVAYQAPPSVGFSRQGYWSELPFLPPGDLSDPGIRPRSPALQAEALPSEPPGTPLYSGSGRQMEGIRSDRQGACRTMTEVRDIVPETVIKTILKKKKCKKAKGLSE